MNTPDRNEVSPEAQEFLTTTCYLDQESEIKKVYSFFKALLLHPTRTLGCIHTLIKARPIQSVRDYIRLAYHLVEACHLAFEFSERRPDHIHCHFISGPTSIGMFLAKMIDVPFSFTMHASIIWIDPIALKTKLQSCAFCASISDFNKQYVLDNYGRELESRIHVVHCGIRLDDDRMQTPREVRETGPFKILSVGQLAKRKGHHISIEAARILKEDRSDIEWIIVGEGDQRQMLEQLIRQYGLTESFQLVGAQHHEVIEKYLEEADVFALPCIIGDDNTRDGIPVALMEAMAWRVPTVSTNIVGIPELIESGRDGILIQPEDAGALADTIKSLIGSPDLRRTLGDAGLAKIDREFNSLRSAEQLGQLIRLSS